MTHEDQPEPVASMVWSFRLRWSPPNDPQAHQDRVNAARDDMGSKYLCHRENRVSRLWRGPVRIGEMW